MTTSLEALPYLLYPKAASLDTLYDTHPHTRFRQHASGWRYEPESKCVYILSLVLAGSVEARQDGRAASRSQPGQRARQNMKAKQVWPTSAAAVANSIMANATPLAPCWHLWYPEAVVFQWKCDRAKSPSWAAGRMLCSLTCTWCGQEGLPVRDSSVYEPSHNAKGENMEFVTVC